MKAPDRDTGEGALPGRVTRAAGAFYVHRLVSGALVMQTTFWGEDPREAVTRAREAVQEFIDETRADNGEDEKRGKRRRVAVG